MRLCNWNKRCKYSKDSCCRYLGNCRYKGESYQAWLDKRYNLPANHDHTNYKPDEERRRIGLEQHDLDLLGQSIKARNQTCESVYYINKARNKI